ncbi:hypothetical protein Daura_03945 [Dactylosporangium aurantiacum]|uniref:Uncharacterized protein n=1 Tax=Dactylosporangium aurantiacum TaxID=35754 RepID=A0A9Q9MN57_9ACTN|nr:hypothetical protein [Dactylosporangium aurantiacum]UWZ55407.1 hypothetical protein Daura_03945 [Dactylosporangium aurantiacum]
MTTTYRTEGTPSVAVLLGTALYRDGNSGQIRAGTFVAVLAGTALHRGVCATSRSNIVGLIVASSRGPPFIEACQTCW